MSDSESNKNRIFNDSTEQNIQDESDVNSKDGEVEVPAENDYYSQIYRFLSSNYNSDGEETFTKSIRKRSTNYWIRNDGKLFYGLKHPRKVITTNKEQQNLMQDAHIDQQNGSHIGIKKMQAVLCSKYHWRLMLPDIGNFIKSCDVCSKVCKKPLSQINDKESVQISDEAGVWKKVYLELHGPFHSLRNEEHIISIYDPYSKWLMAEAVSLENVIQSSVSYLIKSFCLYGFAKCEIIGDLSMKFNLVENVFKEEISAIKGILNDVGLKESSLVNGGETNVDGVGNFFFASFCNNVENWTEKLHEFVFEWCIKKEKSDSPFFSMFSRSPAELQNEKDKENVIEKKTDMLPLTRRRLKSSTLLCRHCQETFTSKISFRIHQRRHTENTKRRITSSGEIRSQSGVGKDPIKFKVKFRFKSNEIRNHQNNSDCEEVEDESEEMKNHITQTTVDAVRNLLNATKEERNKRGKYFKYTPELRDQIAEYAINHSIASAAVYWSYQLGSTVSESSIRNFIRAYKCFTSDTKEEIGRYAFHNGIERAAVEYSKKLGFEIGKGIVLKFKKLYSNKACESSSVSDGKTRQKRAFSFQMKDEIGRYASIHGISAAMDHFSVKLQFPVKETTVKKFKRRYQERSEPAIQGQVMHDQQSIQNLDNVPNICSNGSPGNFVYQHPYSINMTPAGQLTPNGSATVIPMNHNITFHQGGVINQGIASLSYPQPATPTVIMNQPFASVTPSPFYQGCINPVNPTSLNFNPVNSTCSQQPIAIAPAAAHTNSPIQLTMGGPTIGQLNHIPSSHSHLIGHNTMHHQQTPQQIPPFQHPNTVSFDQGIHLAHPTIINEPISLMKEVNNVSINQVNAIQNEEMNDNISNSQSIHNPIIHLSGNNIQSIDSNQSIVQQVVDDQNKSSSEDFIDNDETVSSSEEELDDVVSSPAKKKARAKKIYHGVRGTYGSYCPMLRASIGKYAAENGNLKAISHFKETLGLDVPESTVRGLKEKYMMKKMNNSKEVKRLNFGQRGRPMRLGKYDHVVQDCIKQLIKEGEKVSSFLVIATAKQVLTEHEPSLLEENGGPITLNPTWAKSFLRRIEGIVPNSLNS